MEAGSEGHGAVAGVHPDDAHGAVVVAVGFQDDVDVLDDAQEGLVELLVAGQEEGAVHLVNEEDGADALGDGLTQHGLGLHAHAYRAKKIKLIIAKRL